MPRRDPSAYIWDVRNACRRLVELTTGCDRESYTSDLVRRLACERLLIIIGEALSQLVKIDADLAAELAPVGPIIAFRNVLVHGYFMLDHARVWDVLATELPSLAASSDRVWARFAPLYNSDEFPSTSHE